MPSEVPILTVLDAPAFSRWLASPQGGKISTGVWLTLAKKNVVKPTSLTYAQALDEALCHGWIDGQRRGGDDKTYAQRFTPRTAKSAWSQRNVAHIARLEAEGRMQQQGRSAVHAAKADGRWEAAYAGSAGAEMSPEFLSALAALPEAQRAWDQLSKQERYPFYHRLKMLKTEAGREKRIAAFVELLAGDETVDGEAQEESPTRQSSLGSTGEELKKLKRTASTAGPRKTNDSSQIAETRRRGTKRKAEPVAPSSKSTPSRRSTRSIQVGPIRKEKHSPHS